MDFEFDKVRISDGDDANTPHEDTDE